MNRDGSCHLRVSSISSGKLAHEPAPNQRGEERNRRSQISLAISAGVVSVVGEMAADWEGILPITRRRTEERVEEDEEEEEEDGEEEEGLGYDYLTSRHAFMRYDDTEDEVDKVPGPFGIGFDRSLVSQHTYLGEVDDTSGRKIALLDDGAILSMPMLFLPGVVLFPGATLPLRLIEGNLVTTVEKALRHVDAPCTIGVVLMYRIPNYGYINAFVGTTAEIRQLGRLDDGSVNVLTRGQQRFRLIDHWVDVDGVVWSDIQIIKEDTPLRTPRDAFVQLAASGSLRLNTSSTVMGLDVSPIKQQGPTNSELDCDTLHAKSDHSPGSQSSNSMKSSNEDGALVHEQLWNQEVYSVKGGGASGQSGKDTNMGEEDYIWPLSSAKKADRKQQHQYHAASYSKQSLQAQLSFLPRWAYELYDSYALARRAADLWRRIITTPSMDDHVRKPDLLSFYIGSKLPVSESERQKLLEINGISYRLRREIQLLKTFDLIKCRYCKSEIAKRSDVVVMSSDGPVGAYVNPHGFVHETITVNNATGLSLTGSPSTIHSWFPGYSWTIGSCEICGVGIGWRFEATRENLRPRTFWGIRSSQITDDTEEKDREE